MESITMTDFDERARDWDKSQQRVERARVFADAIRKRIPASESMTALEYGCGTGLLSSALQAYLSQITCADSSLGMLAVLEDKIAAASVKNMQTLELDLTRDPLPAQRFDLIYSLMVLHHVQDTANILRAFHTLLARPGYLCIGDLDQEDGSYHAAEFDGHKGFDRERLADLCRSVGFRNIETSIVFTMSKTRDELKKTYPLFLLCAEKG